MQDQITQNTLCQQALNEWLQQNNVYQDLTAIANDTSVYNLLDNAQMQIGNLPGAAANNDWGQSPTETLLQYVDKIATNAGTTLNAIGGTVLGTNIILNIGQANPDTLWHEFWHVATDLSDLALVQEFINPNFTGSALAASSTFSNWLQNGCVTINNN